MGAGLDSTLGASFIVTCSQTYFYFGSTSRQNKDSTLLSSIVAGIVLLDCFHQIAITSWLSGKNWVLAGFIEACSVAQAGFRICHQTCGTVDRVMPVFLIETTYDLDANTRPQKYVVLVNGLGAGTDILITLCMMALLKQSRTAIKRTNRIIRTIVCSFSVTTMEFCAIMVLSMAVAFPGKQIMMAFYFMLTKVYTNSLLGTLNVRDHLREASERAKWISTASFMFTRTRDIMGTTNNGPVRTTQGAHTVHELGDLKQDPSSQEESGDDIERQTISIKVDQSRDVTQ
ncbi:hypothetical protein EV122DRAFT_258726 [Schizophyllum commune]